MSAHPNIGLPEANQMIQYILSLADKKLPPVLLPPKGNVATKIPEGGDPNKGIYKLLASYTDKGANGLPAQTVEKLVVLRNPTLLLGNAEETSKNTMKFKMGETNLLIVMAANTYASVKKLDLTGVKSLSFVVAAPKQQLNSQGGIVEVHAGALDGPLLGQTDFIEPIDDPDAFSGKKPPKPYKVSISPVNGFHDLYFVFKNDKAKGALFIPFSVTFEQ